MSTTPWSGRAAKSVAEVGMAVFAGRVIPQAQPPAGDTVPAEVADRLS